MKVIIVSIHALLVLSMLISFPTVESMGGRWDPPCMMKRRNMAQNDPLMVPTQSKLVEKDNVISVEVTDEKGVCKGKGMQCWIGGPPPQCCSDLTCSPTQTRSGGYGVCRRDTQTDVAQEQQAKTIKQGKYLLIKLLDQSYKQKRIDAASSDCCCKNFCAPRCDVCP